VPAMRAFRALFAVAMVATLSLAATAPVDAEAGQLGVWSAPKQIGIVGVHAALLHTGKVLFYSGTEGEAAGSVARLFDPVTNRVQKVSIPYAHPAFCSGVTVLPDGRVMVEGGQVDLQIGAGVPDVSIFDPGTETWSRATPTAKARYYPSVVELPDGRVLAVAGSDENVNDVPQMEVYEPDTGAWTTLPSSANQTSPTYPRLALLPNGKVVRVAELQMTRLFDPSTNRWSNVGNMKYGKRVYAGAVLLPGLSRILVAGGQKSPIAT
jgi:hypothetical protein